MRAPDLLHRRPHEVSDGQLQRAYLARALVLRLRWLICDEMTAMLDASTTAALVATVEDYRATAGAPASLPSATTTPSCAAGATARFTGTS